MRLPIPLRGTALVTTALLSASLAACGAGGGPRTGQQVRGAREGSLAEQRLDWKDCPPPSDTQGGGSAPSPLPGGTRWQCATMKAPLDWRRPRGDTIGIALIRARTSGPKDRRIGSLIFNFGGPGGSGVTTLPAFGTEYDKLRTRYDLVSFDPRGVGRSAAVRCADDKQLDAYFQQDSTPDTDAERRAFVRSTEKFNADCRRNSGRLLPHVGTTDAARDMDLLRQVLGDDRLYYFGISYGTELGGVYAHLFPRKVGRAVFDAVVDPTLDPRQSALAQARGFQRALDNFAEDCAGGSDDCPVGDSPQDVENRIKRLLDRLDAKPLPGLGSRRLTQSAALNGIAQSLYSKDFWPYLTEGLDEAYHGDGRILMMLSDSMNGRNEDGHYSNIQAANVAINCADDRARYDVDDVERQRSAFRRVSPLFGDHLAWSMLSCTHWPVRGAAEHPDVHAPGAPPILVVGNTGDPATPYQGARRMAERLGKGVGVQLTWKGQGHGAYDSGDTCVQNAVNGYLLDGRVPRNGTVCE